MIEVRRLLRLPAVLLNFRKHLPRAWKIALIHGRTNRDFVLSSPALHHQLRSGGIQLRPLPDALYNRTESFFARSGKRWYNALLISREFWTFVSIAPHVLLFEVDSILCPAPTVPIEWWVGRYVIVGAPWHPRWGAGRFWCGSLACCVGNSGLSLWNRAVMADLWANKTLKSHGQFVDRWAALELQPLGYLGKLPVPASPNTDLASAFSWEQPPEFTVDRTPWTPFGLHGVQHNWPHPSRWCGRASHGRQQCAAFVARCPGLLEVSTNASLDGEAPG